MRCWFLVLLLGLHRVTDFLPSAQNSENQSECQSNHRQGICCNRSGNRLSSVDLPWNDRPLSLFSSKGPQIGDSQELGTPVGLNEGVSVAAYDEKLTLEAPSRGNEEDEDGINEGAGTVHDGPAKFDSFEKWKHLHLCRYLSEQRKQKQSACAQAPTRMSHEMDTLARDENQVANNEHIAEELGRDCLGQGASNSKKFGDVNTVNAQAEASFANHLELKSLKKAFRQRKNFANANCGAKVVATNEQAQNAKEILSENRDGYMLNPCKAKIWFIVELCERIQIESVEIASFELFARVPKRFKVSATEEFDPALMNGDPDLDSSEQQAPHKVPVRWYDLGTFSCPSFTREIHGFNVSSTARQLDEELTAAIENRVTGRKDFEINTLNPIRSDEKGTVTDSREYIYGLIRKLREEPYVRYVRFEMLEYEGTEHYCPLSLVRIYGSTLEEVINMHEQVDDSLIDAIVSMPGKRAPEVTTEKLQAGNESRLSISHHLFTLVEASRERVSPGRIGDVNNASDCVNPMSDVSAFELLCSYASDAEAGRPASWPQFAGNASGEKSAQRPPSLEVEFTSDTTTNATENGGAGELASETNTTEAQGRVPSSDFGHGPVKRHNGSGKPNKAVSGGAASQPVLVRYGNRLNLLELNTTLYAIYLDQLSEHYNAHMQDLATRLQRLAGELKSQVRRNEELLKFVEQQAVAMAVLQDRLRATEAKLERYSLGGRLVPITICCVSFTCLLTILLSAALNSHYLFGIPNPTSLDEIDMSTNDNIVSSISCHAAGLCDTKPAKSDVASAEVTAASCEQSDDFTGETKPPEAETVLPPELEPTCENGYRDYGHRPLNFPIDFLKVTAVAH